jgi:hypothetical protein
LQIGKEISKSVSLKGVQLLMIKELRRKIYSKWLMFTIPPDESDIFLTAGTCSLFAGVYLIYIPASYILLGCIFMAVAFLQARGEN